MHDVIFFCSSIIASGNATLKSEEKKPSSKAIAKTKPIDDKSHLVFKNYFDFTIQTNYAKPHQVWQDTSNIFMQSRFFRFTL